MLESQGFSFFTEVKISTTESAEKRRKEDIIQIKIVILQTQNEEIATF